MRGLCLLLLFVIASGASAQTSHERYVQQCVAAIGAVADFSCGDGEVVPVTVNRKPITYDTFKKDMDCDRPSLLDNGAGSDGQCVPGSRILNHSTETAQVSVMCRAKHNRPADALLYDEIDVIAHNPGTGATCWFQAEAASSEEPLDGDRVTSPTTPGPRGIWSTPEEIVTDGCGNCHDNDPFMYSPFAGQVWKQVPANPLGPYFHVGAEFGFNAWPRETFELRDNTCTGCHRIGKMETCGALTEWMTGLEIPHGADPAAGKFPLSHAMPPNHGLTEPAWNVFHQGSVSQIRSCCKDPDQQICALTPIKGYGP